MFYNFIFKFLNVLAANIARAQDSSVESSPNFAAAVNLQNAKAGEPKMVVQVEQKETK
jgi:hypothetical protein